MRRICISVFWFYVVLAIFSLLVVPLNRAGFLGMTPDPLAGVFAVLLAQPWISLIARIPGLGEVLEGPLFVAACLALNAALLRLLCRLAR
ncbi:hypothetical protein [Afifella pfennigii]|uniref:hypothetical protein n=1 Tax=Afifella pfennigii TaxID=209897 RepID=UPI000558AD08|nr:hypothetical protein [Afifella pfennigii]